MKRQAFQNWYQTYRQIDRPPANTALRSTSNQQLSCLPSRFGFIHLLSHQTTTIHHLSHHSSKSSQSAPPILSYHSLTLHINPFTWSKVYELYIYHPSRNWSNQYPTKIGGTPCKFFLLTASKMTLMTPYILSSCLILLAGIYIVNDSDTTCVKSNRTFCYDCRMILLWLQACNI